MNINWKKLADSIRVIIGARYISSDPPERIYVNFDTYMNEAAIGITPEQLVHRSGQSVVYEYERKRTFMVGQKPTETWVKEI